MNQFTEHVRSSWNSLGVRICRKEINMNNWIGIGRLVRDPQMGAIPSTQTAVCKFSIAIDDGYGENKKTYFVPVTAFGKIAENCERFLGKGQRVAVQGKIATGQYTNKEGQKVYTTDVIANMVTFIDFKDKATQNEEMSVPEGFSAITDNDLPF